MKSIFEEDAYKEIKTRINNLNGQLEAKWEQMQYRHLDYHFRQFGV